MPTSGSLADARESAAGLFAVACPACGKTLAARLRDAGRGAKCPCCAAGLLLPVTSSVTLPAVPAAQAAEAPAVPPPATAPAAAASPPGPVPAEPLPTFDFPPDLFAGLQPDATAPPAVGSAAAADVRVVEGITRGHAERDRRRGRRSLMMLVIGLAILFGIVFSLTGR